MALATTGRTPRIKDDVLERRLTGIEDALDVLLRLALLDGVLLEGQVLTAGVYSNIPHTLGRAYRGFCVVDSNQAAMYDAYATGNPDVTKYLRLRASATVTVDIWVF